MIDLYMVDTVMAAVITFPIFAVVIGSPSDMDPGVKILLTLMAVLFSGLSQGWFSERISELRSIRPRRVRVHINLLGYLVGYFLFFGLSAWQYQVVDQELAWLISLTILFLVPPPARFLYTLFCYRAIIALRKRQHFQIKQKGLSEATAAI